MKKLFSLVTLLVAFAAVSFAGVVKDVNGVKYYYVTGVNGFNNEGSEKLCDNDVHTKFCSNKDVRGAENSSWWVVIEAEEAVAMTQYSICTANDNRQYTGRNPQSWIVQGTNDEVTPDNANDVSWEDIDEKEFYLDFPLRNYAEVVFKLDAATTPYKYFRFEVTEGNADIIQLSEFWVNEHPHTWGEATVTEPTCSNNGTSLTVCSDCNAEILTYIPATQNHNYKGGLCTQCKQPANHKWILPNGQQSPYTVSFIHADGVGQYIGDFTNEYGWDNAGYEEDADEWGVLTMPIGGSDGQGGYDGGADSGAKYNTAWHGKDNTFWIRRPFNLDAVREDTQYKLQLLHDDNIELYVNGNLLYEKKGDGAWTNGTGWLEFTIDREWLNEGENVVAIWIEQNFGGCYLDFSVKAIEPELKEDIYEECDAAEDAILPSFKHGGSYGAYTAEYAGEAWEGDWNESGAQYNVIVGTPAADASGKQWYEVGYTRSNEWGYTTDRLPNHWSGNTGDIYAIRYFTVAGELPENVFLAAPHDDAPCEYYINGQLVWSETDGWNEGEVVLLTAEQKALIKTDGTKNVFAFHVHQNWGGRYADGGLYGGGNVVTDFQNSLNDLANYVAAAKTDAKAMANDRVKNALAAAEAITKKSDIDAARNELNLARKLVHVETAADVFEGLTAGEVSDGTPFYLYNVGTGRFFCGGDDWGAHAALGYPGIAMLLEEADGDYKIDTRLQNGDGQHYLNFGGYCDCATDDAWYFEEVSVEGYEGAVYVVRATNDLDDPLMLGYSANTYARVDTDKKDLNDPNNMWKIVTKEERDALMENATADEPVDVSHLIKMPNFNQREYVIDGGWDSQAWSVSAATEGGGIGIWGRGGNYPDFVFECWNESYLELYQEIEDDAILPGWYQMTVQGYYRDGNREHHAAVVAAGEKPAQRASLVIEDDDTDYEVALRPVTSVDVTLGNKGTGWSRDIKDAEGNVTGNEYFPWPDACTSAYEFFEHGAYLNQILFEVKEGGFISFLILKEEGCVDEYVVEEKDEEGNVINTKTETRNNDWVVVDNFRLRYFGEVEPDAIQGVYDAPVKAAKGVYNLNGQLLNKAVKGVNIVNGKKYVVK